MITTRIKSKHKCNIPRTALALAASEKIRRAESFASEKHRRFGAPNLFARGQHKGSAHNYNTTQSQYIVFVWNHIQPVCDVFPDIFKYNGSEIRRALLMANVRALRTITIRLQPQYIVFVLQSYLTCMLCVPWHYTLCSKTYCNRTWTAQFYTTSVLQIIL